MLHPHTSAQRIALPHVVGHGAALQRRTGEEDDRRQLAHLGRQAGVDLIGHAAQSLQELRAGRGLLRIVSELIGPVQRRVGPVT